MNLGINIICWPTVYLNEFVINNIEYDHIIPRNPWYQPRKRIYSLIASHYEWYSYREHIERLSHSIVVHTKASWTKLGSTFEPEGHHSVNWKRVLEDTLAYGQLGSDRNSQWLFANNKSSRTDASAPKPRPTFGNRFESALPIARLHPIILSSGKVRGPIICENRPPNPLFSFLIERQYFPKRARVKELLHEN